MKKFEYKIEAIPVTTRMDLLLFINSNGESEWKVVQYEKRISADSILNENTKWLWEILFEREINQ